MASKAKKKKRTKQTKKNVSENSFLGDEIVIWSALAVSILLLISNFGLGGKAGVFLSAFLTDIFGWTVYAVPFALFGAVAFLTANKDNFTAYAKTAAGFLRESPGRASGSGNWCSRHLCGCDYLHDYLSGGDYRKICA